MEEKEDKKKEEGMGIKVAPDNEQDEVDQYNPSKIGAAKTGVTKVE